MNYADIIWKLVELLLNEKDKCETTNDQCSKQNAKD